jgi:hypothetical protein
MHADIGGRNDLALQEITQVFAFFDLTSNLIRPNQILH